MNSASSEDGKSQIKQVFFHRLIIFQSVKKSALSVVIPSTQAKNINRISYMRLLVIILSLTLLQTAQAQKQLNVFDWKADVSVNTWMVQNMHRYYALRQD